jgi:hypothetical protein
MTSKSRELLDQLNNYQLFKVNPMELGELGQHHR